MKRIFFCICIYLFTAGFISAESCECPFLSKRAGAIEKLLNNGNYAEAEALALDIVNEHSLVCKIQGINELFKIYLPQKKWIKIEALLKEQLRLLSQVNCDSTRWLGDYYLNASNYYYQMSNYSLAVEFGYMAISVKEELNDVEGLIKAKQILVQTLSYMNRDSEAANMVIQNYSLILNASDSYNKADNLIWLVKHYDVFYNQTENSAYLDTMRALCNKCIVVSQDYENRGALIQSYLSLDIIAYYVGDYTKGLQYLDSALQQVNYATDGKELGRIHLSKAWEYASLQKYSDAYIAHDSALYYFKKNYPAYELSVAYTDGAEIYALGKNYQRAFDYYQLGIAIRDSITSVNISQQIAELEQKYNKEVNERLIKDLSQENEIRKQKEQLSDLRLRLLIGIIVVIVLLIILAFFLIRNRMMRQKQVQMEVEQRLNRSRINPHFFFNSLTSLQQLSLDDNRSNEVPRYIGIYSKIMRQTLESSYHELISLEEELDFIHKYLEIQKLRLPGKFDYIITVDDEIDDTETFVPTMILQPFIENSIEHGFQGIEYKGDLSIHAYLIKGELCIVINDNGRKMSESSLHEGYPSRATQIIKDRLRLLNKHYRSQARYTISQGTSGVGYKIDLHLPHITTNK